MLGFGLRGDHTFYIRAGTDIQAAAVSGAEGAALVAADADTGCDIVREYLDAFRAEGIKVGLYYSLLDWHHPDYPAYGRCV